VASLETTQVEPVVRSDRTARRENLLNRARSFLVTYGVLIAIVLLVIFFSRSTRAFFSIDNFLLIARAVSILTIVAIGVTLSVSVGGFDVSVGSVTG
jgi:simple sugar transport system permease protein